jgi:hypothetical protein
MSGWTDTDVVGTELNECTISEAKKRIRYALELLRCHLSLSADQAAQALREVADEENSR